MRLLCGAWHVQCSTGSQFAWRSSYYPVRTASIGTGIGAKYHVMVSGPREYGGVEVNAHCYGALNLDAIDRNVAKAVTQLASSSARESDPRLPRAVVLAFQSPLGFDRQYLEDHLAEFAQAPR